MRKEKDKAVYLPFLRNQKLKDFHAEINFLNSLFFKIMLNSSQHAKYTKYLSKSQERDKT